MRHGSVGAVAGLGLHLLVGTAGAAAPDPDMLARIATFAEEFCGGLMVEGGREQLALSVDARARLDGLLKYLSDAGVAGAGTFDSERYVGLLREELAGDRADTRACRLQIWTDLRALVTADGAGPAAAGVAAAPPAAGAVAPGREAEPNDSAATATPLGGDAVAGFLRGADRADWFRFAPPAGATRYTITVRALKGSLNALLRDPAGATLEVLMAVDAGGPASATSYVTDPEVFVEVVPVTSETVYELRAVAE